VQRERAGGVLQLFGWWCGAHGSAGQSELTAVRNLRRVQNCGVRILSRKGHVIEEVVPNALRCIWKSLIFYNAFDMLNLSSADQVFSTLSRQIERNGLAHNAMLLKCRTFFGAPTCAIRDKTTYSMLSKHELEELHQVIEYLMEVREVAVDSHWSCHSN
jgi:hypothetical protein